MMWLGKSHLSILKMNLKIINEENTTSKILFEHSSDIITDDELDSCYNWVQNLLMDK